MDVEALKRYYSGVSEERLKALVAEGLGDLVPEALSVLQAELTSRGLLDLAQAVQIQISGPEPAELDAIVAWLRSSACPICGRRGTALNACRVDSLYDSEFLLGCPSCLDSSVRRAESRNALGCLFAPLGLVFGTRAAVRNREAVRVVSSAEPSDALVEYARKHHATLAVSMRAVPENPEP